MNPNSLDALLAAVEEPQTLVQEQELPVESANEPINLPGENDDGDNNITDELADVEEVVNLADPDIVHLPSADDGTPVDMAASREFAGTVLAQSPKIVRQIYPASVGKRGNFSFKTFAVLQGKSGRMCTLGGMRACIASRCAHDDKEPGIELGEILLVRSDGNYYGFQLPVEVRNGRRLAWLVAVTVDDSRRLRLLLWELHKEAIDTSPDGTLQLVTVQSFLTKYTDDATPRRGPAELVRSLVPCQSNDVLRACVDALSDRVGDFVVNTYSKRDTSVGREAAARQARRVAELQLELASVRAAAAAPAEPVHQSVKRVKRRKGTKRQRHRYVAGVEETLEETADVRRQSKRRRRVSRREGDFPTEHAYPSTHNSTLPEAGAYRGEEQWARSRPAPDLSLAEGRWPQTTLPAYPQPGQNCPPTWSYAMAPPPIQRPATYSGVPAALPEISTAALLPPPCAHLVFSQHLLGNTVAVICNRCGLRIG